MPPSDGSQGQSVSGRFAQALCSSLYCVLNAPWDVDLPVCGAITVSLDVENVTRCNECGERFFDEKGVAFRNGVEGMEKFSMQKAAHVEGRVSLIKDG